jgi:cysteine desulfurase
MLEAGELTGNPSSVHQEGRAARRLLEQARATLAQAVGAAPQGVVFTSGGTEANALALTPGAPRSNGQPIDRLIVSAIEHASVLSGGRFRPEQISTLRVDRSGLVDLAHLEALLGTPALVSVMQANNETGVVQPIAEIAAIVHRKGSLLHVDAVQGFGKIPCNINELSADMVSLSAHKLGGPTGVGALVLAPGITTEALLRGGGQELGRRAGTENLVGIAGFAAAVRVAMADRADDMARVEQLRNRLEAGLRRTRGVCVVSEAAPRLPNTTLFAVPGLKAETAVIGFDLAGIAVSSGSACSSGKVQRSHVLEAIGVGTELARMAGSGVRISLGWLTTSAEIDRCIEAWRKLAETLITTDDETELERF